MWNRAGGRAGWAAVLVLGSWPGPACWSFQARPAPPAADQGPAPAPGRTPELPRSRSIPGEVFRQSDTDAFMNREPISDDPSPVQGVVSLSPLPDPIAPAVVAIPTYPPPSAYRISLGSRRITFVYSTIKNASGGFDVVDGGSATGEVLIEANPPSGLVPGAVDVSIRAAIGRNPVRLEYRLENVAWDEGRGAYVIGKDKLDAIAARLVRQVNNSLGGFDGDRPIKLREPVTIRLAPASGTLPPHLKSVFVPVEGAITLVMSQVRLAEGKAATAPPAGRGGDSRITTPDRAFSPRDAPPPRPAPAPE